MHVLKTCMFKTDWINSNPEKVEASILKALKGSLLHSKRSDLAEIKTHPSFNVCPHYLQVSKTIEKKQRHHFPRYKSKGVVLEVQGQITPKQMVRSSRNLISFKL